MKQIERLLLLQGYRCFFCDQPIPGGQASVEHLVATANGGGKDDENCVVCCAALNLALGNMSVKAKLRVVLNQRGAFTCPLRRFLPPGGAATEPATDPVLTAVPTSAGVPEQVAPELMEARVSLVLDGLRQRATCLPRRVKTLSNLLGALLQNRLSDDELNGLVEMLQARGYIAVQGAKITYALPQPAGDAGDTETA